MSKNDLKNENAFVFHITKVSEDWHLANPFFVSLRDLLLDKKGTTLQNLRKEQEFHFIAKIINDEINNNTKSIKNNIDEITSILNSYSQKKQQKDGDLLIRNLFYIFLLKLLNKGKHFAKLEKRKVNTFLSKYSSSESNFNNFHRVLSVFFGNGIKISETESINNDLDLCATLLYNRFMLSDKKKRNKNMLIDYYLKQNRIESSNFTASSERAKGRLLELAVILKAANGKGLYVPEMEKEQYLSSFTQSVFREKYLSILKEITTVSIFKRKLPIWIVLLSIFLLEALIFALPNIIDSIQIASFSIKTETLTKIPIWGILLVNGLVIAVISFVIQKHISNRIGEEEWK